MDICQTVSFANKILKFVVFMKLMHFIFPQGAVLLFTLLDIAFFARYLLMSQQILGNVPPVVFVKDKEAAAVKEVIVVLTQCTNSMICKYI